MGDFSALQKLIDSSNKIVFFGGAGVSTESGIPDFRSQDGLYNQKYAYPPEEILSHDFFFNHTEEFYRFYFDKMIYLSARPNAAHLKLAQLEKAGKLSAVITQNIDGLHQLAGSENVEELHGSIHRNYCLKCGRKHTLNEILQLKEGGQTVPRCSCGGVIKPDVVLYGEGLDGGVLNRAVNALSEADTLIVGGTSLNVYPAAGLIGYFGGTHTVLINRSETPYDKHASFVFRENIGEVLGSIKC